MIKLTPYVEYLLEDVFRELPFVEVKRMFGGYSYYLDGRIFGFSGPDGDLVFKADEDSKQKFEDLGGEQFIYHGMKTKGPVTMPYWGLPDSIIDDPEKVAEWAMASASLSKQK